MLIITTGQLRAAHQDWRRIGVQRNPVTLDDKFATVNTGSGRICESALTLEAAQAATRIYNEHEIRYGRAPCYETAQVVHNF